MSTLKVNRIEPRTGNSVDIVGLDIPESPVKAWVNFNGTGIVAIRGSFNVGSITDNGAGDYTVNFSTPMPDANYSFFEISRNSDTANSRGIGSVISRSTSSVRFETVYVSTTGGNGVKLDDNNIDVAIFR